VTDSVDVKYIIIGASHAGRLANALREAGMEVADLSEPGWKITADSASAMSALLKDVLEEEWDGDIVIVYQLFDNSSYVAVGTDGTATPPAKGSDGRYHINGALAMVDRDQFKQLFSLAVPLLRAGGQNKKILVSPLCRYALENCCDNPSHCTNRGEGLKEAIVAGLSNLETWTDDQAYLKRIRNFMVFNPNDFLSPDDVPVTKRDAKLYKMCWNAGPVHMSALGYEKLAASLMESVAEGSYSRAINKATSTESLSTASATSTGRPASNRGQKKVDWSQRRQSWVLESDTVAHRQYGNNPNFRGRGVGKWRGRGLRRGRGGRGRPY
jgi:hypothetical protein